MWTWAKIIEYFEKETQHPRPSWEHLLVHSQAMLKLIPQILADKTFTPIQPFLSHATLCLSMPNKEEVVSIYAKSPSIYEVSLFTHTNATEIETKLVSADDIMKVLREYTTQ